VTLPDCTLNLRGLPGSLIIKADFTWIIGPFVSSTTVTQRSITCTSQSAKVLPHTHGVNILHQNLNASFSKANFRVDYLLAKKFVFGLILICVRVHSVPCWDNVPPRILK
jgi:hypothetical protein